MGVRGLSLKTKISVGVVLMALIALAATLNVVIGELREEYQRTVGEDLALLVSTHAAALDSRFDNAKRTVESLAASLPERAFDVPGVAQKLIERQTPLLNIFDLGLYIADRNEILTGVALPDMAAARQRIGLKTPASEGNRVARESRRVHVTSPYASPSCDGCPAVVIIVAVFDQAGELRGYVAGGLRLTGDNLLASLSKVGIGKAGYFYLSTRDRVMIMHPDAGRVMKTAAQRGQNPLFDRAVDQGFEGFGKTVNSSGTGMIVAFKRLASTDWVLAGNYPSSEAEEPFSEARDKAFRLTAALGILLLAVAWFATRRMFAPLSALTQHVAALATQGTARRSALGVGGEIGTLENAFNETIEALDRQRLEQQRIEEEVRQLNASLESKVSERTAALEASNHELASTINRLTITQQELVEAEKLAALGALVAGIAHELNTPIGNCVLVASGLDEQIGNFRQTLASGQMRRATVDGYFAQLDSAVDILNRNLEKASLLINSFKQAAVDRTADVRRHFALDRLIADTVTTMQPMLKRAGCTVASEIPPDMEMDSFPGSLGQSLAALLENATVHAYPDRNGGIVRICAAHSGENIVITVSDEGAGIPPEIIGRIFEPFFTTRFGKGGSGLGLHIVYNIVTGILRGRIAASSAIGEGTRFVLTIPRVVPD